MTRHPHHSWHILALLLGGMTVAACSNDTVIPSGALNGYWSADDVHFSATDQNATFIEPCATAVFDPITADSSGGFDAVSVSFAETGNVIHYPDDRLHLLGKVSNDTLRLTAYIERSESPAVDPVALRLIAGGTHGTPTCSA